MKTIITVVIMMAMTSAAVSQINKLEVKVEERQAQYTALKG
jgi:hypothetical protein